jgi:lipopolysaccharide export system permease protein
MIDLDSFKLTRTSENYFTYYHSTKTTRELNKDIVEMKSKIQDKQQAVINIIQQHYQLPTLKHSTLPDRATDTSSTPTHTTSANSTHAAVENRTNPISTQIASSSLHTVPASVPAPISEADHISEPAHVTKDSIQPSSTKDTPPRLLIEGLAHRPDRLEIIQKTLRQARDFKYQLESDVKQLIAVSRELKEFQLEKQKRTSYAVACLIMLLIGASLGALIKKGGLGVPLLVSTVFILIYYVADIFGTKWAKIGLCSITLGAWGANLILIPFALFFLWQAQQDTRILDRDAYRRIRWRRTRRRT